VWYGLSIAMILISVVSLATRGLNLGVDFTGGVTVQATFPNAANRDAVVKALDAAGYADPQVTIFGTSRDVAIRLPPTKQSTAAVRNQIEQVLRGVDGGAEIRQVEVIGPQIGGELQHSARQSLPRCY
jgi:preprotein translocase subunit SecF